MSPSKTAAGVYRFDRVFRGVGRVQVSAETRRVTEFRARDALLTRCYQRGRLDLLRALKAGRLSILELVDADRRDALGEIDVEGQSHRPFLAAAREALTRGTRNAVTLEGYLKSLRSLEAEGVLRATMTVHDLAQVDWTALEREDTRSPAHWNHARRAISRALTLLLGDEHHPLRRAVMKVYPARTEIPREPDVTPDAFLRAVEHMQLPLRPVIMAFVATGLRRAELGQLRPDDLMPLTFGVRVRRRTKNATSLRVMPVDPRFWPWIVAAVPCPMTVDQVLRHWSRACRAAGLGRVTLHDIRHLFGQWAADGSVDEGAIQKAMGHKTRQQTAIYTARRAKRQVSAAVADALGLVDENREAVPHVAPHGAKETA